MENWNDIDFLGRTAIVYLIEWGMEIISVFDSFFLQLRVGFK